MTDVKVIVEPERYSEKIISSVPDPAGHSPATPPDAESLLAAVIASLKVHSPSAGSTISELLSTVIVTAITVVAKLNVDRIVKKIMRFLIGYPLDCLG